jgi:hypothetical protein
MRYSGVRKSILSSALASATVVAVTTSTATLWGCASTRTRLTEVAVCTEGEPCWDCNTIGNVQCGPGTISVSKAEGEAHAKQQELGDNWNCWAEVNSTAPGNYEVMCDYTGS